MIWPDAVVDAGAERQKQLEYAKDLELQIELRRAIQREQQQEQEALERKFQPDDHSPAKWLIEGGYTPRLDMQRADYYNNNNGYRSPSRFQQQQPSPWSQMNSSLFERPATSSTPSRRPSSTSTSGVQASAATGQPSGSPSIDRDHANAHTRFRITDLHSQDDRLRERAQQMEWKRILDEQIREKARIKQQEEEEQKRSEREAAQEETMFLRDQQLRAQRRLGYHIPPTASQPQSSIYTMQHSPPSQQQYEPTSDSPHDQEHSDYRQRFEPPILTEDGYVFNEPQRNKYHKNYYTTPDDNGAPMPPPAPFRPSYSSMPSMNANREVQQQQQPTQSYDVFTESRSHLISEYRSLLADIRRERDELRQEKEELRKEKEELRLERALLQLENEKMATFLETQRRWRNEEQSQRSFRPHSSGDNVMLPSPLREYNTPSLSTPQRSPQGFERSMQMHQMERSFAALGLGRDVPRTPIREQPKPSPISMDDFMAVTPQNRLTPNVMDSPRIKRLSQFRGFRATTATQHEEEALPSTANSLDQSLAGESVFVSLSPDEIEAQDARTARAGQGGSPPRITETVSPRRGKDASERGTSDRNNMLRNSRVIKSRGFYNIEKELKALSPHRVTTNERSKAERKATDAAAMMEKLPARRRHESRRRRHERNEKASGNSAQRGSQSLSPAYRLPQRRSRRDHENDEEDEQKEEEPELSRSLFQVKVLV